MKINPKINTINDRRVNKDILNSSPRSNKIMPIIAMINVSNWFSRDLFIIF
jgi:hypothetical protein